MQRTALGAADVPEVNSSAHRTSTSRFAGATSCGAPALLRGPGCVERSAERLARGGRIVAVGEALGDEDAAGQIDLLRSPHRAAPGGGVR